MAEPAGRAPEAAVRAVAESPGDAEAAIAWRVFDPGADQTWHADRGETVASIEDGGAVVATSSCDMTDLLGLARGRGWSFRLEAAGVAVFEP